MLNLELTVLGIGEYVGTHQITAKDCKGRQFTFYLQKNLLDSSWRIPGGKELNCKVGDTVKVSAVYGPFHQNLNPTVLGDVVRVDQASPSSKQKRTRKPKKPPTPMNDPVREYEEAMSSVEPAKKPTKKDFVNALLLVENANFQLLQHKLSLESHLSRLEDHIAYLRKRSEQHG